jgi:ubiquinone/menaquinone biosynthesis C-methylase UbiE
MNTYIDGELRVFLCPNCGHCQTFPLNDLKSYYENDYEVGRLNEEDDQLYAMSEDGPIYRAQHQAEVLLQKVNIEAQTKVLDFGCGKSLTMRRVCGIISDFKPFVYDVTDKYYDLWLDITNAENCAVNNIPESWDNKFDVVTSFYALEHIEDLSSACRKVRNLLSDCGYFYFIIPDMIANPADFIVADHVNHFSKSSLSALMERTGFEVEEIDHSSHYGAIICLARKSKKTNEQYYQESISTRVDKFEIDVQFMQRAYGLAEFWSTQNERLVKMIGNLPKNRGIAIYGAGFYGTYLYGIATGCGRNVECFIDSNPHMIGEKKNGITIVAPSQVPTNVENILVGLNPSGAKAIIAKTKDFGNSKFSFLYIE